MSGSKKSVCETSKSTMSRCKGQGPVKFGCRTSWYEKLVCETSRSVAKHSSPKTLEAKHPGPKCLGVNSLGANVKVRNVQVGNVRVQKVWM